MKVKWTVVFSLIIILASATMILTGIHRDKNLINCRANFIVSNYDLEASVVATVRTGKAHGVIFYDGPLFERGVIKGYLSRKVLFSYERENEMIHLRGNNITRFRKDDVIQADAERVLPDFFVKAGAEIFFDIARERNGYFFIKDNFPMFFCRNIG